MMTPRCVRCLLALLIAAPIAACAPNRDSFTAQDDAAIRAASAEYARLETFDNAEKWAALSAPDAIMIPEAGNPVRGRPALAEWVKRVPAGARLATTTEDIVGRGDVAIERGSYVETPPAVPGAAPQTFTGSYLLVWQKQSDGRWLIVRNIWNSGGPTSSTPDLK